MSEPITRIEKYLAYAAGEWNGILPTPVTRVEQYLYDLCINGGGGGDVSGVKGANETEYRKGNVNLTLPNIVNVGNGVDYNSTTNTIDVKELTAAQLDALISKIND